MESIRHVLAATDLSPASLHAVDRAIEIAHARSARCTLMTALGLDALGPLQNLLGGEAQRVTNELVARQRAALEARVAEALQDRDIRVQVLVEAGLARTLVPARAAASGADLVVVGSRGQGRLRHLVVGSTASHLLRKSPCPVLVVKAPFRRPYRRVLVAVDFSPASELAIAMARQVAPDAEIVLMNVFDVPFEGMLSYAGVTRDVIHGYRADARENALLQLHGLAGQSGLPGDRHSLRVQHGDAARLIVKQAELAECDLIVMGKHGTHVTEELLLGSVTRWVLAEVRSDVLVVVDKRAAAPTPG